MASKPSVIRYTLHLEVDGYIVKQIHRELHQSDVIKSGGYDVWANALYEVIRDLMNLSKRIGEKSGK